MRASVVLEMKRSAVREATSRFRAANPRVFGSALHGTDREGSDLDLLTPGQSPAQVSRQRDGRGATGISESRLTDYLEHMQQAATDARNFVREMVKDDFLAGKRTQQAVIMSLMITGEAATRAMDRYDSFTQAHPEIPWRSMRGMRNRIAHAYFEINLDVVWDTVQMALPQLPADLPAAQQDAERAI